MGGRVIATQPVLWFPGGKSPLPVPAPAPPPKPVDPATSIIWSGSPNFWRGRPHDPVVIMIHTMGGTLAGTESWFGQSRSEVSSHFSAGLNNQRRQHVLLENQAWMNGILETGNRWQEVLKAADIPGDQEDWWDLAVYNPNAISIGIETEDLGDPRQVVTEGEFHAVFDLCRVSMQRYPDSIRVISSHHIVSPRSRANCAGSRWMFGPIQRLADALGLILII